MTQTIYTKDVSQNLDQPIRELQVPDDYYYTHEEFMERKRARIKQMKVVMEAMATGPFQNPVEVIKARLTVIAQYCEFQRVVTAVGPMVREEYKDLVG